MHKSLPPYVILSNNTSQEVKLIINELKPHKIAILVDENTTKYCLSLLNLKEISIIEIESGERNKTLKTCQQIWEFFTKLNFSRNSLMINLGGGVIGDMGGFAAAVYKRGIKFVNVPTTLLSQVDASVGGKLGIDFEGFKNHIGVFQTPYRVIIDTNFLTTLSEKEKKSGYAEVLKHALIKDKKYWEQLKKCSFEKLQWNEIVAKSVAIKHEVVQEDPKENGLRKILNFGHTLGHAIESFCLNTKQPLLHGEAIAMGIILESYLSWDKKMLKEDELDDILQMIKKTYTLPSQLPTYEQLKPIFSQDKKNYSEYETSFSLINGIGKCVYDVQVTKQQIKKSIDFYHKNIQ